MTEAQRIWDKNATEEIKRVMTELAGTKPDRKLKFAEIYQEIRRRYWDVCDEDMRWALITLGALDFFTYTFDGLFLVHQTENRALPD